MAKILVVDDEKELNNLLCIKIKKSGGHEMLQAYGGEQCLEIVKSSAPDLIVLDVMMPGLSGFEVFQILQEDVKTRSIPVIIFSALSDPKTVNWFKNAGAKEYIIKSADFDELMVTLNEAIEKHIK